MADAEGISYYSEASLERMLNMEHAQLLSARRQLSQAGLILYREPLYQVLSLELPLDAAGVSEPAARCGQARPMGDILRQILGGAA